MRVGVLAVQGGFSPHLRAISRLGHLGVEVRDPGVVASLDGLVLPGGESTVQLDLLDRLELVPALARLFAADKPVLATCAGLILAARRVRPAQPCLGWIDVEVERNAYGRQIDSAERLSDGGRALVLIRAPRILAVGAGVEILDSLGGEPVLVRAGQVTAATFHPELAGDDSLHEMVFGRACAMEKVGASA
jgi:pyridoxal 5'-phosphate synthase pdxT subunit